MVITNNEKFDVGEFSLLLELTRTICTNSRQFKPTIPEIWRFKNLYQKLYYLGKY